MTEKLLILDLDETLIHGSEKPLERDFDFKAGRFHIHERPHLRQFLAGCRDHFRVAIWTTASADYAEDILREICPDLPLAFAWCRERCTPRGGFDGEFLWIKDLKKVKNLGWNLGQVLVVEDKPQNICRHYGNVIRIAPFKGDEKDQELLRLLPFLLQLKEAGDVRTIEKRRWRDRFNP